MNIRRARVLVLASGSIVGMAPVAWGQVIDDPYGRADPGCHIGCGKSCSLRHMRELGLAPDGTPMVNPAEALSATDVLHCNLDIEVVPASGTIIGANVMQVRVLQNGLTEFSIRLRDNFTITAATIDGSTPVTVQQVDTSSRRVVLPRAYSAGEEFSLRIAYNGPAVSRGFGSIEFASQGGFPLVATLSEPYFAYTWWPCKDGAFSDAGDNSDKFTLDIAITAPSDLRSVANGVLQGVDALSGSRSRYRWHSDYPISTYLVAFCTTRYNTYTQSYTHSGGTMPVEINLYPSSDTPANRAAWFRTVDMLAVFRGTYGEYPFINEKYGVYQFPFGGGMEHQTNTGQGTFDEGVTAHELGHQWWGDMVTCRTWRDIWLNEGGATYSQAIWNEFKNGFDDRAALHSTMQSLHPGNSAGSVVYVADVASINSIFNYGTSYLKASWVYHMLRGALGDEAFFDGLAFYRAAFEGSAATTDDFGAAFETATGYPMGQYLGQWIYGSGTPTYVTGFSGTVVDGQAYVRLRIRQSQPVGDGAGGKFTMPIEFSVAHAGGPTRIRVFNDERTEHFVVPVPATPTGITIDPDNWILDTSPASEAFVQGPPVVIAAAPGDGAIVGPDATVTVKFIEAVVANAGDFELTGPGGAVPCSLSPAPTFGFTLTPLAPLAPGAYTLRVQDSVVAASGGRALDGDGPSLPSGDGLAGGDYVFAFSVDAPCPADLSGSSDPNDPAYGAPDGAVDSADFFYYLDQFVGSNLAVADLTGSSDPNDPGYGTPDGAIDASDFFFYLDLFVEGCP
jgi:aminopeptidase N